MARKITNNLAELRKRQGCSAAALAAKTGITRQAIHAIESGAYVPNTAVSLRLAEILGVRVDEIFQLESRDSRDTLLANCELDLEPGTAVQLGRVAGTLVALPPAPPAWYLPITDAMAGLRTGNRVQVRPHEADLNLDNRLIIAGCDPAASLLARHLQRAGVEVVLVHRNSAESLSLLKNKRVHFAGTHLRDSSAITSHFSRNAVAVVSFAVWQEGLITAAGNPKRIKSVEDLARKAIRFVNREEGAGTRLLLDNELARLHMKPSQIHGYKRQVPGHLAAAAEVNTGAADCCIATEAAARVFGLTFVPLATARYDLVLRRADLELPSARVLFDLLADAHLRRELSGSAGYDTAVTGDRVSG